MQVKFKCSNCEFVYSTTVEALFRLYGDVPTTLAVLHTGCLNVSLHIQDGKATSPAQAPQEPSLDPIQEAEMEGSNQAINEAYIQQAVTDWEGLVLNRSREIATWVTHVIAGFQEQDMNQEQAFRMGLVFMEYFIRIKGGMNYLVDIPDITDLYVEEPSEH